DEKKKEEGEEEEKKPNEMTWAERQQQRDEDGMPGPMMRASVDVTHPMTAGVREWVGVLKRNRSPLPVKEDGYVVARFEEDPYVGGVISEENREKFAGTPFVTHHSMGRGTVICFSDDITIRGFMHAPMRLLMNAIIYGPNM
ncbi:MAG: hypothetical protein VYC34_11905, partial [Planctomycetota bacterium]|nr:hypothetical protein [Planctomycetota bacterium]